MSHQLNFATSITSEPCLRRACDRMREAGLTVTGPQLQDDFRVAAALGGGQRPMYLVGLPGWNQKAAFACDSSGLMVADNYSPYFDERQLDAEGRRTGPGRVHPQVASGEKRVGDNGRWGDIKWLDRLQMEYRAALVETALPQIGGTIVDTQLDEAAGTLMLTIETL